MLYVFIITSLSIALSLIFIKVLSKKDDDEDETVLIPNRKPILTRELMPGFALNHSDIHKDKKTRDIIICEYWHSEDGTLIKFDLYPCKNHKDALDAAKKLFYATTDENQRPVLGKPVPGSFSGQTVGDFCWIYTSWGLPMMKIEDDPSRGLVFIKGKSLVYLRITNTRKNSVPVDFAEDIAKKIVSRIK